MISLISSMKKNRMEKACRLDGDIGVCVWGFSCLKDFTLGITVTQMLCLLNSFILGHSYDNNHNNNRIQRRYSRFFTISSQCRELSPTRTLKWPRRNRVQITCNTSSAYHVQHVVLCATWYEGTAQLLSLTELKSHLFELYFVG